jgi:hypothetical protein
MCFTSSYSCLLILLFSLTGGCAARQDVRLEVVDALTGRPLAGVQAMRYGANLNMLSTKRSEREVLPPTTDSGLTEGRALDVDLTQCIALNKDGYAQTVVKFNRKTLPAVHVLAHVGERIVVPDRQILPEKADDERKFYRIQMQPLRPEKDHAGR